jgi:glycosyltransferase involved in cell wall biosynthesis
MRLHDVYQASVSIEPHIGVSCRASGGRRAPALSAVYQRRLNILLVVEASAGGTGRHVLDLADGFIRRGHHVHLAHSTVRIDQLFRDRLAAINGLVSHALPMRMAPHPSDYKIVRAIRKIAAEHGPFDIVHGHSSKGGALARFVAVGSGAKAFYTLHGMNSMDPGLPWWKSRIYVSIERMLALCTAGIITVSPEENRAAASAGLGNAKTRTIPNGLDHLDLASRETARDTMGVSEEQLVVGFVGRLVEQKAPEILVTSFATVAASVPNARLAIVGDGPLHDRLVSLSQQLEIADKIIWLGARDARQVLSGFDLFALSSRKEGLPYVILEAMCAGLPIVATSSSGVEILVEPGVNGSVVAPDSAPAFAQAILHLLQKPTLLARFGAASRQIIGRFTVDAMVESTLSFYRSSLHAPGDASVDDPEVAPV